MSDYVFVLFKTQSRKFNVGFESIIERYFSSLICVQGFIVFFRTCKKLDVRILLALCFVCFALFVS